VNGTTDAVEETSVAETEAPAATEETPKRGSAKSRLEEEGDIAADYLEELMDITDLDGDIDIDIENGRASVAIVADEAGTPALEKLVGASGDVLEALQELTRLAVQAQTGDRTRLMLDVAGHRLTKRGALVRLAGEVVARVRASGAAERLEPMPAFERKVVHDAVAAAGLLSESEGEEPRRRVVVLPTVIESGPQGDDD
jgi:spoIIIJ-associated protein